MLTHRLRTGKSALKVTALSFSVLLAAAANAQAAETIIPASSLISSGSLYSNNLGGVVVTTDGGNAPGMAIQPDEMMMALAASSISASP